MKAAHMTVTRSGLTFKNGESYLVVTDGDRLVDIVEWPGWPKQRPTTQEEMNEAVEEWFKFAAAERAEEVE